MFMALIELRPRVRFTYAEEARRIFNRIGAQSRRNNPARLQVEQLADRTILSFPPERSEIWTPQMEVIVRALPGGGSEVKAIIGPRSSIWMVFRIALMAIAALGLIGLIVGFFQWNYRDLPWGFYLAVAGLCSGLFIWFLSEEGKRRSQDEMALLRTFMDNALGTDQFQMSRSRKTESLQGGMA